MRKQGVNGGNIWGPDEVNGSFWQRVDFKHSCKLMWRPYQFLLAEPIVTALSLFSGFSDALIFTGLDAFGLVMGKWHFSTIPIGLCFIALLLGYLVAYGMFVWRYYYDRIAMDGDVNKIRPERRLWLLLFLAPLLAVGLFGFAWTSFGPHYNIPWIAPLIFLFIIGLANFAIYMATVDYMIAAYGKHNNACGSYLKRDTDFLFQVHTPPPPPAATASLATSLPASPPSTPHPSTTTSSAAPNGNWPSRHLS